MAPGILRIRKSDHAPELWREAFDSEDIPLAAAHHHADMLERKHLSAAAYMRELVELMPATRHPEGKVSRPTNEWRYKD
jgi:hypothetical protein